MRSPYDENWPGVVELESTEALRTHGPLPKIEKKLDDGRTAVTLYNENGHRVGPRILVHEDVLPSSHGNA